MWVTIPEGFEVPAPLVKKRFEGGLYAAHMIPFGAFEEWSWLFQWIGNSEKHEYRGDTSKGNDNMNGLMEEQLNYINRVHQPELFGEGLQLDLLMPVKIKK